jgi:flagellar biosynthesis anti-sigma factor FlgM
MKIEKTQLVGPVDAARAVGPRVKAGDAQARVTDQASISKLASELRHVAFAAAPKLEGATATRIAEIRDAMKRGSLRADPGAIADKMMAEIEG